MRMHKQPVSKLRLTSLLNENETIVHICICEILYPSPLDVKTHKRAFSGLFPPK